MLLARFTVIPARAGIQGRLSPLWLARDSRRIAAGSDREGAHMVEETAQRLLWTASNMSLLGRIATEFETTRPFAGRRIGVSLHLEVKTAVLLLDPQGGRGRHRRHGQLRHVSG